jgi:hypothetical protein
MACRQTYPCSAPAFPCAVPCSLPTGPTGPTGSSLPTVALSLNTISPPTVGTAVSQAIAGGSSATAVVPFTTIVANSINAGLWNNQLFSFTPTVSGWYWVSLATLAVNGSASLTSNADLIIRVNGSAVQTRTNILPISASTNVSLSQLFFVSAGQTLQAAVGNSSANAATTTFSNQALSIFSLY